MEGEACVGEPRKQHKERERELFNDECYLQKLY